MGTASTSTWLHHPWGEPVAANEQTLESLITHEHIHSWGVPDLYDAGLVGKGTGHYDIMSGSYGWDGMQTHPFFMSPWTHMKMWVSRTDRDWVQLILSYSSICPIQIYIIRAKFPEGKYLFIENWLPLDYDAQMKGSDIIIWHIDDRQDLQKLPG